ncbi:type II toxin-antitoxin system RelE/ParE family toxin [Streptomyces yatensis]|uniref:Addiction module antitoxin n=1 Tax=Streptomyces yatensis TaxID=155177 RepID=A0ABN2HAX8_9ACTN|nr:type II toxin-antitoxin system RelE/ParE family toxin [Streptomyces yatensis]
MNDAYVIEIEPEVRAWLELLPGRLYRKVEAYVELLAELGPQTPMPYARPLREGVAECRREAA